MADLPHYAPRKNMYSWSEFFTKNNNKATPENEKTIDKKTIGLYRGDAALLLGTVELLREVAALLIPSDNRTVRAMHHCFSDIVRERITGICDMRQYGPFTDVIADHLANAFQPGMTRHSATKIPTLDEFLAKTTAEEFVNVEGTSKFDLAELSNQAQSLWIHSHYLAQNYDKQSRSIDVAVRIIADIGEVGSDIILETERSSLYDQLILLLAIAKGYPQSVVTKDPPRLRLDTRSSRRYQRSSKFQSQG
jgi:hypothetical protein